MMIREINFYPCFDFVFHLYVERVPRVVSGCLPRLDPDFGSFHQSSGRGVDETSDGETGQSESS